MNMIHPLINDLKHRNDDELTTDARRASVQRSGVRTRPSIPRVLPECFPAGAGHRRDRFLVDYLQSNPAEISAWKNSTDADRRTRFKPSKIRQLLDARDKFQGNKRGQIYGLLSKHASHPTYAGFQLLAPDGLVKLGPFFDAKRLQAVLEEIAKRLPYFTLVYQSHFQQLPPQFLKAKAGFLNALQPWGRKYLGVDAGAVDLEEINQLMRLL